MSAAGQYDLEPSSRRGTGWMVFAATMLILGGGFKILDALWAFKYEADISEEVQTIIFERDPAAWGWVWLAIGVLLIVAGFVVVTGSSWARWFGVVAAGIAAIGNYPWITVQPVWTFLNLVLLMSVIYALLVYGGNSEEWNSIE